LVPDVFFTAAETSSEGFSLEVEALLLPDDEDSSLFTTVVCERGLGATFLAGVAGMLAPGLVSVILPLTSLSESPLDVSSLRKKEEAER
jgi:hypothetical protein